jgi:alpha-beta hydrolase superfamily lysophospholipase
MPKTTLRLSGVPENRPDPSELQRGLPAQAVTVRHAVRLESARADVEPLDLAGLADDDVVEIELEDGLRVWTRVDQFTEDVVQRGARSVVTPGGEGLVEVPPALTVGPASRAGGGLAIRALKILGIDLEGTITDIAAEHVEGRLSPGPGLYRCVEQNADTLQAVGTLDGAGPVLVFLHGTASSTSGSFGGLWAAEGASPIAALFQYYQGRVLAFQHRTLTQSPIENALALVEQLGGLVKPGTEVHLVSHSRGGLVGELLARGMRAGAAPFTPDELALFDGKAYARDRAALEQLSGALQQADLRVTKFVRVACPARGTTLADRRLDRYVSVLVNLASLIPGLRGNPVYEGLTGLLAGVLKKRTSPEDLPGLEAMMPTSPLVRMLNNPDVRTTADLHVLGGDFAGTGIMGRLKTLATDFYYRDDHDLVVNTPAMLGGTDRTAPILYWIDTGGQVTHFHYFARADTARRLVAALTGTSTQFHTLQAPPSAVTSEDYRKRAVMTRPVVVVLPGIMGSELSVTKRPVWMSIRELSRGGLTSLAIDAADVVPTGLLGSGYAALCTHLKQTHEVVAFPYDWRRSLTHAANALCDELDMLLPLAEAAGQPIRLLAHSMGGLVVRRMLTTDRGRAIWERMCQHAGARVVMLGTPNQGSFAIPAMLMGRDALVKKLALVDLRNTHASILSTIAAFEGVLHLLPYEVDGSSRWFDRAWWADVLAADAPEERGLFGSGVESSKSAGFRWTIPSEATLDDAATVARELRRLTLDPARVVYVAGVAPETASDVVIDPDAPKGRRVRVFASRRGDGRVLWDTGIPSNVPSYFMDTVHGDMANDRRHFAAIVELLESGATSRLSTTPPVSRAADTERSELSDRPPTMVPDEQELIADALGGRRQLPVDDAAPTRIRVNVRHDNLTNARNPVLVSHYEKDVIVAAEKYLDMQLDGRLSELLRLDLYPGPINTAVVARNDRQAGDAAVHPGAIVTGLGMVGELTPGRLTSTLTHALTLYGSDCVGQERRRRQRLRTDTEADGVVSAAVTAVLIGSGEGGVSLGDSVRSLLRATLQANQRLRQAVRPARGSGEAGIVAQIDTLEIIELYEDRAVDALHALHTLVDMPEFAPFEAVPHLVVGDEGLRRVRGPQPGGWWQRIRISTPKETPDVLTFEAVTQTARAPSRLRRTQRDLVDGFLKQAFATTRSDDRLGHTLFQMLVPNDFKAYAPDQQKLALLLDKTAAGYPWELLQDGFDRRLEPLAVSGGMVRQLLEESGRHDVLRPTSNDALVVGNPIVHDRRFPSLKGARDEAVAVASMLTETAGYDVQLLLEGDATPRAVLTALHDRPWRILHLAAHGVFEHLVDGQPVTGLVLDNGLFLTVDEVDQLRYVPDVVFINCCHLGQTRGDAREAVAFHRLAANVATQFIRMGARAVVAAGWAVDDAAAKTFAKAFYRSLLGGSFYGDAVLQARRETYQQHGDTNTWGAYQCYGDPSFSLSVSKATGALTTFVSARELGLWLDGVPTRAREGNDPKGLLQEVESRLREAPEPWLMSADICALAAGAFMSLGQYAPAIPYFAKVVQIERANAPVAAVEQFVNCRVRHAEALGKDEATRAEAQQQLELADQMGRSLLAIGETSERLALLGGVMKRRAQGETKAAARRKHLEAMRDAYARGWERSLEGGKGGDPYPLGNAVAAEIVLQWGASGTAKQRQAERELIASRLEALDKAAEARAHTNTDVYNLLAGADRLLLKALLDGALGKAEQTAIADAYTRGLSRGATRRERDSIRTQFGFFKTMAETELSKTKGAALIEQLTALEKAVLG